MRSQLQGLGFVRVDPIDGLGFGGPNVLAGLVWMGALRATVAIPVMTTFRAGRDRHWMISPVVIDWPRSIGGACGIWRRSTCLACVFVSDTSK